ncbi:hypothetical protein G7062_07100 [Erysipelothrix sp. HDW6C]|uniref:hypothetical protein n=1 Tax=Erysipelothrix sp. HDW6C TaxID=2714930 RepID=UPI00140A1A19|nr:hypothetical protein [Erysipelothrix sp. HDW6C]QIK70064.1 hypothetical protein G7062_07100 [Erysipelothrix sp. HDW6C]
MLRWFNKNKNNKTMGNPTSIYNQIKTHTDSQGRLATNFEIPKVRDASQIQFAQGARDGIGIYHMQSQCKMVICDQLVSVLSRYKRYGHEKTIIKIKKILDVDMGAQETNYSVNAIARSNKQISDNIIRKVSLSLMQDSHLEREVKFGIALAGLLSFDISNELSTTMTLLASYEEFTLYSVISLQKQSHGNTVIFDIAQHVHGWGKIYAVENLEPETEEICSWILREGCDNAVLPAYLGLTCATKGCLIDALRENVITGEDFEGIATIIDALLDEGPTEGISVYEHATEALNRFLAHAAVHQDSLHVLYVLLNIKQWIERESDCGIHFDTALIDPNIWKMKILEALTMDSKLDVFYATNCAKRLHIDISTQLWVIVEASPILNYHYVSSLIKTQETAQRVLDFYEHVLPLDEIASGMGFSLGLTPEYANHRILDTLLFEIEKYPGIGSWVIVTALNSPVTRNRNVAMRVIKAWTENEYRVSDEVTDVIREIRGIEVEPNLVIQYDEILTKTS